MNYYRYKLRPLLTEGKRSAGTGASFTGKASVGGASTNGASAVTASVGGAVTERAELDTGHDISSISWRPEELR